MIEKQQFHIFNYIMKEEYTGSMKGMRYMLRKSEEGDRKQLETIIWPEPYCYGKTPEKQKQRAFFPLTEAGLETAADWLNEQYNSQPERWKI